MVVKRSVTVHPVVDEAVRKLWAILIEKGYDTSYSTTLSMLALGGYLAATLIKEGSKEWQKYFKTLNDFLDNRIMMKSIDESKAIANFERNIRPKIRHSVNEKREGVD